MILKNRRSATDLFWVLARIGLIEDYQRKNNPRHDARTENIVEVVEGAGSDVLYNLRSHWENFKDDY